MSSYRVKCAWFRWDLRFFHMPSHGNATWKKYSWTEQIEWRNQQQGKSNGTTSRSENWRNQGWNQISHGSLWVSCLLLYSHTSFFLNRLFSLSHSLTHSHNRYEYSPIWVFVCETSLRVEKQETTILLTTCTRNWHKLTRNSTMWKENARRRRNSACKYSLKM